MGNYLCNGALINLGAMKSKYFNLIFTMKKFKEGLESIFYVVQKSLCFLSFDLLVSLYIEEFNFPLGNFFLLDMKRPK